MQVTYSPQAAPACCIFCPGSVRDCYVDTEISFDFYGAILICDQCVANMGHMLGMHTQNEVVAFQNARAELEVQHFELQKEVAILRGVVDTYLKELVGAGSIPISTVQSDNSGGANLPLGNSYSDVKSQAGTESVGTRKGTNPESSFDENLGVVPTDEPKSDFILDI